MEVREFRLCAHWEGGASTKSYHGHRRSHGANTKQHRAGIANEASGQCEVLAKCERATELPQNAETRAPRADANDGEKAGAKQAKMLNYTYKPFWRSEAAAAQVSFVKILRILSEIHSNFVQYTPHRWKAQAWISRLAALGGHSVLHFRFKNELAIRHHMVRADVFQKCCHSGQIILGKQIRGLIQGQNECTSRFEPRHTLLFDIRYFLGERCFLAHKRILFGGVFRCG